jgi:hypothetical protein
LIHHTPGLATSKTLLWIFSQLGKPFPNNSFLQIVPLSDFFHDSGANLHPFIFGDSKKGCDSLRVELSASFFFNDLARGFVGTSLIACFSVSILPCSCFPF